jgi:hypothetical protein
LTRKLIKDSSRDFRNRYRYKCTHDDSNNSECVENRMKTTNNRISDLEVTSEEIT